LPFTRGFERLSSFDRGLYFAALLLSVLASAFLIAPSAHHRLRFRARDKERLVLWGNRMAITGLGTLSLAVSVGVSVVADFLYGEAVRIPVTLVVAALLVGLWFVFPRSFPGDAPPGN
jgi:hypothetical protein